MKDAILKRLKEPSTQAGIAGLLSAAAMFGVPQTTIQAVSQAAGALLSIAAIFLPESK
ncbi:hypothetical protein GWL_18190 [Herbaspirillum sp. GW103]|uniref:hypothetical protein n=1 Tax=Herbaspirillum sp. GW103 TaxID=1175306 RepID=UPI00025E2EB9|nr:hypothetical protein [Herbaspirillum sp. GW103]EIJ47578.1 hypothetical protein GWL_18190 [Herbaspirillum sp. GW103]